MEWLKRKLRGSSCGRQLGTTPVQPPHVSDWVESHVLSQPGDHKSQAIARNAIPKLSCELLR